MPQVTTQNFTMIGDFEEVNFQKWIQHRADILDVDLEVKSASSSLMEISASGHPILIDAFEIACSLGPLESTVDSIVIA